MAAFRQRLDGERRVSQALTRAYTREELGEIFDAIPSTTATLRSFAHAVGTAWADYEHGGWYRDPSRED